MNTRRPRWGLVVIVSTSLFLALAAPVAAFDMLTLGMNTLAAPDLPEPAPELTQLSPGVEDVLKLIRAKVSDDVTVAFIQSGDRHYNLSASEILYLRKEGVSDRVLEAMLSRQSPPTTAPTAPDESTKAPTTAAPVAASDDAALQFPSDYAVPGSAMGAVTAPLTYVDYGLPVYYSYYDPWPYWYWWYPAPLWVSWYWSDCFHHDDHHDHGHGDNHGHGDVHGHDWNQSSSHNGNAPSGGNHSSPGRGGDRAPLTAMNRTSDVGRAGTASTLRGTSSSSGNGRQVATERPGGTRNNPASTQSAPGSDNGRVRGGNSSPASGSRNAVAQNGTVTSSATRSTPSLAGTRTTTQRPVTMRNNVAPTQRAPDANINRVRSGNGSPPAGSRSAIAQNRPVTVPATRTAPSFAGTRSPAQPMRSFSAGSSANNSRSSFTYRGNANAPSFSRPSATPSFGRTGSAGSFRSGGGFAASGGSRMSSGGSHGGMSGGGFSHGGGGGGGFGHGR